MIVLSQLLARLMPKTVPEGATKVMEENNE